MAFENTWFDQPRMGGHRCMAALQCLIAVGVFTAVKANMSTKAD